MTDVLDETEVPVIELVDPMPGFPAARRFALVELAAGGLLFALRSVEDPDLRFLAIPPLPLFPDYAPEVDDDTAARLGLTTAEDALVLLVVSPGESPEQATANLLAPVVLHRGTHRGAQVVQADSSLPLRAPLRR